MTQTTENYEYTLVVHGSALYRMLQDHTILMEDEEETLFSGIGDYLRNYEDMKLR